MAKDMRLKINCLTDSVVRNFRITYLTFSYPEIPDDWLINASLSGCAGVVAC